MRDGSAADNRLSYNNWFFHNSCVHVLLDFGPVKSGPLRALLRMLRYLAALTRASPVTSPASLTLLGDVL